MEDVYFVKNRVVKKILFLKWSRRNCFLSNITILINTANIGTININKKKYDVWVQYGGHT